MTKMTEARIGEDKIAESKTSQDTESKTSQDTKNKTSEDRRTNDRIAEVCISNDRVAIIHYWLVKMRGGEKVLEALCKIFPAADLYTHVYNPKSISESLKSHTIRTTFINKLPFAKKLYPCFLPLMPYALKKLDLHKYALIISSESGPAKGVMPVKGARHICYCHTPMRYIWDLYHEYYDKSNPIIRFFMRVFTLKLRMWDVQTAGNVDCFIANSQFVARRIQQYYGRESIVVFPPVAVEKFINVPRTPEDFYLFFGQLAKYKRLDIAIKACIMAKRRLIIAGSGAKIKGIKSGLIEYRDAVKDSEAVELLARAKALLFPGIEDFGIVPVEAMAAGCPVIAYRKGGAVETVLENVTGLFFDEQTPESLAKAMFELESNYTRFCDREPYRKHVEQFSAERFEEKIKSILKA
jgi:glycosyltransferase involved in cell wall biosynthesis